MQNPHPSPYFLGEVYGKCRVCFPQLLHSPQNTGLGIVIHLKSEAGNWSLGNLFIYIFKWYDLLFRIFWIFDECSILKQRICNLKKPKNKWLMKVKADANYGSCLTLISY